MVGSGFLWDSGFILDIFCLILGAGTKLVWTDSVHINHTDKTEKSTFGGWRL